MPLPFDIRPSEATRQRVRPKPLPVDVRPSLSAKLRVAAERIRRTEELKDAGQAQVGQVVSDAAKVVGRTVKDASRSVGDRLGKTTTEFLERTARNVKEDLEPPRNTESRQLLPFIRSLKASPAVLDTIESLRVFDVPFAPVKAAVEGVLAPLTGEGTARTVGEFAPLASATGISLLEKAKKIPEVGMAAAELLGIPGVRTTPSKVVSGSTQSKFIKGEKARLAEGRKLIQETKPGATTLVDPEVGKTQIIKPGESIGGPIETVVRGSKKKKPPTPTTEQSLSNFVIANGGISIPKATSDLGLGGEFRALREAGTTGKKVVLAKSKKARSPEEIAELAHQAGFIDEPSSAALADALRNDLEGRPVFSKQSSRIDTQFESQLRQEEEAIIDTRLEEARKTLTPDLQRKADEGDEIAKIVLEERQAQSGAPADAPGFAVEQTRAGAQTVIPGAEGRQVPTGPIRGRQSTKITPLEEAARRDLERQKDIDDLLQQEAPPFFPAPKATRSRRGVSGFPADPDSPPVPANYDSLTRPNDNLPVKAKNQPLVASRTQMVSGLRKALGVPIRKGLTGVHGALGFFRPKEEVIRVKFANDIETISHEVGHFLSKDILGYEFSKSTRARGPKTPNAGKRAKEFQGELTALGRELYGNRKPNGGYAEEGIAEFVRLWVTDQRQAQTKAPRFFDQFSRIMESNPDVSAVLADARDRFALWREQGPEARTLARISFKMKPDADTTLSKMDQLVTNFLDDLHPLKVVRDRMAGRIPFSPQDDFYLQARLLRGLQGKVEVFLNNRTFDFDTLEGNGKSLKAVLAPVADAVATADPKLRAMALDRLQTSSRGQRVARSVGSNADLNFTLFRAYLVAKRDLELAKRGIRTGEASTKDLGITKRGEVSVLADSTQVVAKLEREFPAFQQAQRELVAFQDRVLDYYQKGGMLSPESVALMRKMNRDYIPFYRLIEEEVPVTNLTGNSTRVVNVFRDVKRIKGSDADIVDPLESVIKNTHSLISLAERNNVARSLVRAAESREGLGQFVEGPIPKPLTPTKVSFQEAFRAILQREGAKGDLGLDSDMREQLEAALFSDPDLGAKIFAVFRPSAFKPKEPNIVQVIQNGEPTYYRVSPTLNRALNALDIEQIDTLTRILSIPARTLRLGATQLNPEFAVRNFARDQISAWLFTNYGYKPGVDFARGVFSAARQDDLFLKWKSSGADQAMIMSMDRARTGRQLADVMANPRSLGGGAAHVIFHPVDAVRALSVFSEIGTRLGEFRNVLNKETTLQGKELIQKAGFESREITLDFGRKGAKMRALSNMTAFLNANIQGMNKAYRVARERPKDFAVRAGLIATTSTLLYLANRGDPRVQELPQWQRDIFWIIPSGEMDSETWEGMTPAQKAAFSESHPIFRFPKPYEYGVMFGSMPERILEWIDGQNPKALDQTLLDMSKRLGVNVVPNAAQIPMDILSNNQSFFDRPIVPRRTQDLSPEAQYGVYTSETAKEIGGIFNQSPAVIDYIGGALFGRTGLSALEASDAVLRHMKTLPPPPEGSLADVFMVRAFVARQPTLQSPTMEAFWDGYLEGKRASDTIRFYRSQAARAGRNSIVGRINFDRAKSFEENNGEAIKTFQRLAPSYKTIRGIQKRMERVRMSDMDAQKKRRELDTLSFRIQGIAERAIEPRNNRDRIESLLKRVRSRPKRTIGDVLQTR